MISRETFKNAINFLKRLNDLGDSVNQIYKDFDDIIPWGYGPFIDANVIVDMLNESFNLEVTEEYGSDLEYWLWECDFGKEWNERETENTYLPENHQYRKPKINNLDELYNYLVWQYNKSIIEGELEND